MDEPAFRCEIGADRDGSAVLLRGSVSSDAPGRGRYRFDVKSSGGSGTSDIGQGGEFVLEPGVPAGVGQVGLNLDGGRRYDAILTVTVEGRTKTCRRTGP